MKKTLQALLFVFVYMCGNAQITNIKNSDSTFVIHQLYVGLAQASDFSTDSLSVKNWTGLRIGTHATYILNKVFSLNGFFALNQNSDGSSGTINAFVLKTNLGKNFTWINGLGPQVSALFHRPNPVSFPGHFEPWTRSQIPGGGLISRIELGKTRRLLASVSKRNDQAEFHFGFDFNKKFLTSVWINQNTDIWGGAITYNLKNLSTTVFIDQEKFGYFAWVILPKDWGVYLDLGISTKKQEIIRGEFGVLKSYQMKSHNLSGVIGIGYSYEQHSVRGYLTLRLSD